MIHHFFLILAVFIVLPAESTIVRVYIRKISPLCPNQQRSCPLCMLWYSKIALTHALMIVSPWTTWPGCSSQSVFSTVELVRLGGWPTFCYHVNGSPRFVRKCVILAFVWKLVSGKFKLSLRIRREWAKRVPHSLLFEFGEISNSQKLAFITMMNRKKKRKEW